MKNKWILALMIIGCMALPGCGENTTQKEQNISVVEETDITGEEPSAMDVTSEESQETVEPIVDKEEEGETGSFKKMSSIFAGKYRIDYQTKTTGHPSGEVDFMTGMDWKDEELGIQGGCIIDYYIYDNQSIEEAYDDYANMEEAVIADKTFKVVRAEDTLELLYKVDDSFYVQVILWHASQFDEKGSSMELTVKPADYLDRGWLDETITFEVVPLED